MGDEINSDDHEDSDGRNLSQDQADTDLSQEILVETIHKLVDRSAKRRKKRRTIKAVVRKKRKVDVEGGDDSDDVYVPRATSRCSVPYFFQIIKFINVNPRLRKLVSDMGFGHILQLDECYVPRAFVQWLADNTFPEEELITFGNGFIKLSAQSVVQIVGIPQGSLAVEGDDEAGKASFLAAFGLSDIPSIKYFGNKILFEKNISDVDFCRCFMAVALDYVDFGSIQLPHTMPRIHVWKGDMIKHFSDMTIGKDGKYGARSIMPMSRTCYAVPETTEPKLSSAHVISSRQGKSEIGSHPGNLCASDIFYQQLDDLLSMQSKQLIINAFDKTMKDEDENMRSKAMSVAIDVIRLLTGMPIESGDTERICSEEYETSNVNVLEPKMDGDEQTCNKVSSQLSAKSGTIPMEKDDNKTKEAPVHMNAKCNAVTSASFEHMLTNKCSSTNTVENEFVDNKTEDALVHMNDKVIAGSSARFEHMLTNKCATTNTVQNEIVDNKTEEPPVQTNLQNNESIVSIQTNEKLLDGVIRAKDEFGSTNSFLQDIMVNVRTENGNFVGVVKQVQQDGTCSVVIESSGSWVHITTTEESIDIVEPKKNDSIKVLSGSMRGFQGKLLGVAGSDEAIVRLEGIDDLKVLQLVTLGVKGHAEQMAEANINNYSDWCCYIDNARKKYHFNDDTMPVFRLFPYNDDSGNYIEEMVLWRLAACTEYNEQSIQCGQKERQFFDITSSPEANDDLRTDEIQTYNKLLQSSSVRTPNSKRYFKEEIVGRQLFPDDDYASSSQEVKYLGTRNFNDSCKKLCDKSDDLYNTNLSLRTGSSMQGKENLPPKRIVQPSKYYNSPDDNKAKKPITPNEYRMYEVLTTLCDDENFSINIDNCKVSLEQLGKSFKQEGWVEAFVINSFCRKLFRDCHPKQSGKHYFFNTVSDYFLEKYKNEETRLDWQERAINCFQQASSASPLHLAERIYFPSIFTLHWFVFAVDIKYRYFLFLDSIYGRHDSYQIKASELLIKNFKITWREAGLKPINFSSFDKVYPNVPKQKEGNNCGIHCMKLIESYCPRNPSLYAYSDKDVMYLRVRYAIENLFSKYNRERAMRRT
ncbi:hypothetical protein ACQ4PT_027051 [Festuca glaucescens]